MNEWSFIRIYSDLANNKVDQSELQTLYKSLKERVGSDLERFFQEDPPSRLNMAIAVDAVAHTIHQHGDEFLQEIFPGADNYVLQKELDHLAGNDDKSEIRKYNRGYFTTLLDDSAFIFLEKERVGKAVKEDISDAIVEYQKLFSVGMASPAEKLTLSRYFPGNTKYQKAADSIETGPMVVGGPASVEMVDRQKHLITTEALDKAFTQFMKTPRTRNIQILHTNVQVGWPLPAYISEAGEVFKSGVDDKGLWLISELRDDIKIAKKVIEEIESGKIKSYSIAGTATETKDVEKGLQKIMRVDGLEMAECTLCLEGVNQGANFNILKSMTEYRNEFGIEEIQKSLGDFDISLDQIMWEDGEKPCVVINSSESNAYTDMLKMQLRKMLPEDFPVEIRSVRNGEWTPLIHLDLLPVAKDYQINWNYDDDDDEEEEDEPVSKDTVGYVTAGVGNSRINMVNPSTPMEKHWFYRRYLGEKQMAKSAIDAFADWQKTEEDRRKAHRSFLDQQGQPAEKDYDGDMYDLSTDRITNEVTAKEIKSTQGYDVHEVQDPSEG